MTFRVLHRYLGFFLAGIMMIYAVSGITLIFRKTDTFKKEVQKELVIEQGLTPESLGQAIRIKGLQITEQNGDMVYFKEGTYNIVSGEVKYKAMELPVWLDKITHLHKATDQDPLYYFNIFFGSSLLFFAVSAFYMFVPKSPIFKKGLLFTLGGIILAIIMLYVG